jgi:two-component system cell cycle sensor histidine kinase/response regulator CckA
VVLNTLQKRGIRPEKKLVQPTLRRKEDQYRLIAENARDLISLVDREGRVVYVSPSIQEILGYEQDELLGQDAFSFIHPDDRATAWADFLESSFIKNRRTSEYRCRHKNGQWLFLESINSWMLDERGKLARAVIVSRDITARRYLEEQLRQSQKMEALGRLAGGVAHDFNNMLTAILGFCEMLDAHLDKPGKVRKDADQIRKAGERASALTRQLLAFSRRKVNQAQVLDLNHVIVGVVQMLGRLIGENIQVITDLKADLWHLKADPGQAEQVIMNLALNARDAMPAGGQLTLATTSLEVNETAGAQRAVPPGQYVVLEVTDNGTGMDAETQARIFEPFFTTKEQGKGTGLGLSTVYAIVTQNDGFIRVNSEPGQGTTFELYFPRTDDEVSCDPEPSKANPEPPQGSKTILLVEDEELVRSMIHGALVKRGYQVLEASNGWDALQIVRDSESPIDLLLTDMVMPLMGGQELARRLLCLRSKTKVLLTTGYGDEWLAMQAERLPTEMDYLLKPFTSETLIRKVGELLEERRA